MAKAYLGVDYGERRIGLARALDGESAAAWQTLVLTDPKDAVKRVIEVATTIPDLAVMVVGLPRNLEGVDTPQTAKARAFAAELASVGIALVSLQDEAATSDVAKQRLEACGKPYDRGDIDAESAAIILQDYLDNL